MLNNNHFEKYQWYENNETTISHFFQEADNRIAETKRKRQEAEDRARREREERERKERARSEELFVEFRYLVFSILESAEEKRGSIKVGSIDIDDFASYYGSWGIDESGLKIFLMHSYDKTKDLVENEKTILEDNFDHVYLNKLLSPLNIKVIANPGEMTTRIPSIDIICLRKVKTIGDYNQESKSR